MSKAFISTQLLKFKQINLKIFLCRMTKLRRVYESCDEVGKGHTCSTLSTSPNGLLTNYSDKKNILLPVLTETCSVLKEEKVIAVPTDTIYGVAGLAQSSLAVNQIYNIKRRDVRKPIAICVGSVDDVEKWGKVTVSKELLEELLPGPVTVVFERTPELNPDLNPWTSLIGIRVPDHKFVTELSQLCNEPLALTSANISTEPSALCVQEFEKLWPELALVVDGGKLEETETSRQGSTVVDLSKSQKFTIIRPGSTYIQTKQVLQKYGLQEEQKT